MSAKDQSSVEKDIPELVEDEDKLNEAEDDSKDWDEWHADEDDEESSAKPKCTSCDEVFASTQAVLAHIKDKHNFDFEAFVKASVSDPSQVMYHHIRLVNYLRSLGAQKEIKIAGEDWKSEKWLKSTLEDDPLLYDHEYEGATGEMDDAPFKLGSDESASSSSEIGLESFKEMSREEVENRLRRALADKSRIQEKLSYLELHLASLQRLNKTLLEEEDRREGRSRADSTTSSGSDSSTSSIVKEIDSGYFGSYAGFHIHEDMLKDRVRTEAYRDFIEGNPELFKDKYVMDVGCGTGILSMFAIRAGAKHVIAIDNSGIIERAKEIAKENGFENKITFIRNKAEQIEELAGVCDKVDIIISEWMGYCLLFESMLPSVLFVRDKFLKPQTGRVYPDISSLHLVGMSAPTYRTARVDFWKKDVYGFTMESIARRVHLEPGVDHMQEYEVITDSHKFFEIDCNKVKPEQLDFEAPFTLKATKDTTMDAFVTYFDIGFLKDASKPITFTTSPSATETHWRQTVLILEQPLQLTAGTSITGRIQLKANRESFRDLDIHLTYRVGSDANAPTKMQSFSLN